MPDYYTNALIIAREIKEVTGKVIMYLDIAQMIRNTDTYQVEETNDEIHITFIIKKTKEVK